MIKAHESPFDWAHHIKGVKEDKPVIRFKHYKKGDVYTLVGFAVDKETNEQVVVYADGKGGLFTRKPIYFFDKVWTDDGEKPRFQQIFER